MDTLCIRDHYEPATGFDDFGNVYDPKHDEGDVQWWDVRPAVATLGKLCRKCSNRIGYHFDQAPQLLSHIRSQVTPSMQSARGERVDGTRDPSIPMNATAVNDADDLYARIANWVLSMSRSINQFPPTILMGFYLRDVDVEFVPPAWGQLGSWRLMEEMRTWYRQNSARIVWQPFIGEFHDDLVELVRGLMARYPQAERVKQAYTVECPTCGQKSVEARWVGAGAHDVTVECTHCGQMIDPDTVHDRIDELGLVS